MQKEPGLTVVMLFAAAGTAALLVMIVLSSLEMSLGKGLAATVDTRWGITTLVDLYLGLFAVAGWIAYRERHIGRTALWFVALCLLGNLTTLVYLMFAAKRAKTYSDLFQPVQA